MVVYKIFGILCFSYMDYLIIFIMSEIVILIFKKKYIVDGNIYLVGGKGGDLRGSYGFDINKL